MGFDIYDNSNQIQPSITKVSCQLWTEALPIYYSQNVFQFNVSPFSCSDNFCLRHDLRLSLFTKIGNDALKWIRSIEVASVEYMIKLEISTGRTTFHISRAYVDGLTSRFGYGPPVPPMDEEMPQLVGTAEIRRVERTWRDFWPTLVEGCEGAGTCSIS